MTRLFTDGSLIPRFLHFGCPIAFCLPYPFFFAIITRGWACFYPTA